ncbi:hypothetical protein JCM10295v2_005020 [Rhodotorula toruloides]
MRKTSAAAAPSSPRLKDEQGFFGRISRRSQDPVTSDGGSEGEAVEVGKRMARPSKRGQGWGKRTLAAHNDFTAIEVLENLQKSLAQTLEQHDKDTLELSKVLEDIHKHAKCTEGYNAKGINNFRMHLHQVEGEIEGLVEQYQAAHILLSANSSFRNVFLSASCQFRVCAA